MSAQARELLRLLRLPSNRTCADCDAPLTDSTNVWASVTHGVFICVNCVSIHRKVGVHISRVRSVNHDVWADEEIAMMKLTNGNAVFNQTFERYIPRSMHKPTPDASWEERETWIRCKYEYKAFMIPLYSQEDRKGGKKRHARDYSISHKTNLPMRLVDYFVVVGLDEPNPVLLSPRPSDFLISRPPPLAALSSESFSASFSSVKTTQGEGASTPNHSRSTPNSPAVGPGADHNQGGFPATASSAPSTPLTPCITTSTIPTPSTTTPVLKPEHVRLSCCVTDHYPDEDAYVEDGPDGCPMPEHVSQFVFPDGFMLHVDEQPPAFFSFVLTNVNGVRSYGCALRVTEDVDTLPDPTATRAAIASAFEGAGMEVPPWVHPTASTHHSNGLHTHVTPLHGQGFYVPKTLVVLSHYPFFDIFREVLLEVYRISISSAPLPIERYIANFVCEVPLPPQGQIEIKYALPDRTLTVARPPKNKLPLTSVSFRPLFTLLNVDNILLVFGLLLTETRVALCSSKYALLTPVSEALLSLLFPFVWQGAFIPVMPAGMADILDAPVPFFVGLHRRYLDTTKPAHRPAGVVFVDLDNDEVILGADEDRGDPRQRPRLPEREMHKLRQKLVEFGAVAYNPRCPEVENADLAFPNNEHHLPISSFATEQGMTQKNQSTPTSVMASFGFSKLTRGRADAPGKPGAKGGGGAHLANATLNMSILSAGNNEGMPDNFSADQIRAAFLRFFVSILRNYQSFIQAPSPDAPPAPGAEPFNKEAFLKESSHLDAANDTLATVISSQMFERFIEERIANPDHPQIKFFDESIVAKLNRSKTQLKKVETSFLDNNTDQITETFNPPPPSNWGLPDTGEGYTYPCFPRLRPEMYGNIRKPRRLFKFPEQQRTGSKSVNAAHMLQRSLSHLEKATSPVASPPHTPRAAGKLATLQKQSVMVPKVVRGFNRFKAMWRMHRCRSQYKDMRWAQGVITKQWRAYASGRLARGRFVERRTKVICIQKVMRGHLTRKAIRRRHGAAVKLQLWLKMVVTRRAYLRRLHAIRRLQALFRGRRARQTYLTIRDLVILVQATVRGWLERRHAAKERQQRLSQLRRHIFYLWKLAHTPLIYRSKFWMLFDGTGFLHIAIHEDEAIKLWRDLGFLTNERLEIGNHVGADKSNQRSSQPDAVTATPKMRLERGPSKARGPSPRLLAAASFVTFFRQVEGILQECEAARTRGPGSDPALLKASTRTRPPPTGHGAYSPPLFGLTPKGSATQAKEAVKRSCALDISLRYAAVVDTKHLSVAAERLEAERAQLYWGMKQAQNAAEGAARDSFFAMFGLQHGKKRKRHLCQLVWQDLDHAEQSSEVVLATLGSTDSSKDWVQAKLDQRIRSDLLSTVQACLLSIHEQKSSYRRIRKRYIRTRRQLQESTARASQLLHGPSHHRRQMSSLNSFGSYDGGVTSPTGTSVNSLPLPPLAASPDTIVERVFRSNDTSTPVELKTIHEHSSGKGGRLRGVPRTSSASITPSPVRGGPVGFSSDAVQVGSAAAGAAGGVTVGQQL